MKIAIIAPFDKHGVHKFLQNYDLDDLPLGYQGAPFLSDIVDELISLNHKVIAITTTFAKNDNYNIQHFIYNNFEWIVIPSRPHSFKRNGIYKGRIVDFYKIEVNKIVTKIYETKPDFVHAHWSYEFAFAAILSGLPHLVTVHDNAWKVLWYYKNLYRCFRLIMSEYVLKNLKYASTVSPYMFDYVKARCENVRVIPNPITLPKTRLQVSELIKERKPKLNSPKVLMINNGWNEHKNGNEGLKAFKLFQKKYPNAKLYLFGSGSEINGLAYKDATKLNLHNNIHFMGVVKRETIMIHLQEAHLLLHPALEESFGVVLTEAMSMGVPVIGGQKSGAVPWVIDNDDLLCNVKKHSEITNKMLFLFSNKEVYTQLAIKCYDNVVDRFSNEKVVGLYLNYYEEIIRLCKK